MVTVEDIYERIRELNEIKAKPKLNYHYANSDEYIDHLIEVNRDMLDKLLEVRH